MKIYGYFICWNEEKIIPYFLRYYEPLLDRIFIYDNGSSDSTIELLSKSSKVEIREYNTNNKAVEEIEIKLKSQCWLEHKNKSDWCICGDMDEFIYIENFRNRLYELDKLNIAALQLTAYQMVSLNFPSTRGQIYEEINRGARLPFYDKIQVINTKKVDGLYYAPGCHQAYVDTKFLLQKSPEYKLLHFKMMGAKNVSNRYKILNARRSEQDIAMGYGVQYSKTEEQVIKEIEELWKNSILVI